VVVALACRACPREGGGSDASEALRDIRYASAYTDSIPPISRDQTRRRGSERDPEAGWTAQEGKKRCYGYKLHVAMDQGSRIVRRLLLTPANVNETVPADDLVIGDEQRVYADKAYDSHARRKALPARGIRNGIMRRAARFHPLGRWALRRNAMLRVRRAPIEPLFALIKHVYGFARAPYRGFETQQRCPASGLHRHEPETLGAGMSTSGMRAAAAHDLSVRQCLRHGRNRAEVMRTQFCKALAKAGIQYSALIQVVAGSPPSRG
jgi:IS5 family transposase